MKRPRLSIEELKHAALRPSTHRTYSAKCRWWLRFLEENGHSEQAVDGDMLCAYVKYLFDNTRIRPLYYE